jgi:negative regulator of sigma E activity
MDADEELIRRQLDAVVGDEYRPPRKPREFVLKWVGAAVLAVATAAVVMGTLHRYMTNAETAPRPKKPVTVTIVPSK